MKMNLATGGKDPNAALFEALARLGLTPASQGAANPELRGAFRGRPACLQIDGSEVMQAANRAYYAAANLEVASALGLVSSGWASWKRDLNHLRARSGMRDARMSIVFVIDGGRTPAAQVVMGRDASMGHPIAPGLFCQTTQEAWPHLAQPYVLGPLSAAPFDQLRTREQWIEALWAPQMREWQGIAASPPRFADAIGRGLSGLCALADVLCPR